MQPYNKKYMKNKRIFYFFVTFIIVIVIATFLLFLNKKENAEKIFVGKVVKIEGSVNDIGIVEKYIEGKSLLIKSENESFRNPTHYQLGGSYSIKIIANSLEEYLLQKKSLEKKTIEMKDEMPAKISSSVTEINSENPLIEMPKTLESDSRIIKNEKTVNVENSQDDEKYIIALNKFELDLENIIGTDMNQLNGRWDQFVSACLINSDSKKYLSGRKWFQFYEDLNKEKADVSLTDKLKYYENPTCVSYESEIVALINSIKYKINQAEKNANNAGVYSADISSIERSFMINRREWKEIEIRGILKQRDIRDYNWLNQR